MTFLSRLIRISGLIYVSTIILFVCPLLSIEVDDDKTKTKLFDRSNFSERQWKRKFQVIKQIDIVSSQFFCIEISMMSLHSICLIVELICSSSIQFAQKSVSVHLFTLLQYFTIRETILSCFVSVVCFVSVFLCWWWMCWWKANLQHSILFFFSNATNLFSK